MSKGAETGLQHSARSGFAVGVKHLVLSICLIVAIASVAKADSIVIDTDASWLAKNAAPGAGWNTAFAFDTVADGGWQAAQNNGSCGAFGCMIWWDGQFSATDQVWLRKTFVLNSPIDSASIVGGVDDDATIWVNGTIVYDVFDSNAGGFGPIDLEPYLVQGNNLIAVFADDLGGNHQFIARTTIETAASFPVPAMSLSGIVLLGLLLLAFGLYTLRGHIG